MTNNQVLNDPDASTASFHCVAPGTLFWPAQKALKWYHAAAATRAVNSEAGKEVVRKSR
jgi:hypothetical protein